MTTEQKAKAYDKALKVIKGNLNALNEITTTGAETVNIQAIKNCFYRAFPELKESEDERTRKAILEFFKLQDDNTTYSFIPKKSILAWLEKQKESPKSADSIPSDCVSDAKCENRWHKVCDFLPDNPREVLCKDEAGNYFIGRYYVGEGWEISNYDDEDKPHHLNPPVSKWIDFPSEKQKEQKLNPSNPVGLEQKPAEVDEYKIIKKHITEDSLSSEVNKRLTECGWYVTDEKPKEWSEEDEKMRIKILEALSAYADHVQYTGFCANSELIRGELMGWLKSLRPQPKQERRIDL